MKISCCHSLCIISILIIFIPANVYTQDSLLGDSNIVKFHRYIQDEYGLDQILVNGENFQKYYSFDLGHPYLFPDGFHPGYLVLHDKKYENLLVNYDIFKQKIVVNSGNRTNNQEAFVPPVNFISEFYIHNKHFRKYSFNGNPDKFYQEVYSGSKLKCLYTWNKERTESYHQGGFLAYKFSDSKRKSYLLIDEVLYHYKKKRGFLKIFPKELRTLISNHIEVNKVNVLESSDESISELLMYSENIWLQSKSGPLGR